MRLPSSIALVLLFAAPALAQPAATPPAAAHDDAGDLAPRK